MSQLALHLFGTPRIELDDVPVSMRLRKATALLIYLALNRRPHGRDKLATLLYPRYGQSDALGNLRRTLSTLNKAIGDGWLDSDRQSIALRVDEELRVDTELFRHLAEKQRVHGHPIGVVCQDCLDQLEQAVALYQDDFLAGFTLSDCPEFDSWQRQQGESLRQLLATALEELVEGYIAGANYTKALHHAQRWCTLDPLHESAHRALMTVYALSGQKSAALRQYEECTQLLQNELGTTPSDETTALFAVIKYDELPVDEKTSPHLVTSSRHQVPLGRHPVTPSPPHNVTARPRHNLPAQTTPFIGREEELAHLTRFLVDPAIRLVTILAPGGMGKTRLAQETAATLLPEYRHGVYFVELAPLSEAADIPTAIADVLSITLQPGSLLPQQQLLEYLAEREALLVLDNFEHLLDGVDFVNALLQAAPLVKVLVTSRQRLQLSGETVFALDGIRLPDWETPEDALEYAAVKLFLQSAQRTRPGYDLNVDNVGYVARICRLVHGMPLGILLAAAWVEVLSAQEIADEIDRSLDFLAAELRDLPKRQRSIRAVFASSWQRLSPAEQDVFMRLSVFRGGLTREAAQTVTQASLPILSRLVSNSLLRRDSSGRYQVHELLRQYAEEQLRAAGRLDATCDAHSAYFADFLQARDPDLKGRRQLAALQEIEADWENVRTAWQWAVERRDYSTVGRALESLYWFCIMRSRLQAGQELLRLAQRKLAPVADADPDPVWGRLMARAMKIQVRYLEAVDEVKQRVRIALAIAQTRDDRQDIAFCLWALGMTFLSIQDPVQALPYFEESLEHYQAIGDQFYIALLLFYVGFTCSQASLPDNGAEIQSLEIRRVLGDRIGMANSLNQMGTELFMSNVIFLLTGRVQDDQLDDPCRTGESNFEEAYAIQKEMGNRQGMCENLPVLTTLALMNGDLERSSVLAWEMQEIAEEMNSVRHMGIAALRLGQVAFVQGDLVQSRRHFERGLSFVAGHDYAVMCSLEFGLSLVALEQENYGNARQHLRRALDYYATPAYKVTFQPDLLIQAALLLAQAEHLKRATSLLAFASTYAVIVDGLYARLRSDLEAMLPPADFAAAWARGQTLQWEATREELMVELSD